MVLHLAHHPGVLGAGEGARYEEVVRTLPNDEMPGTAPDRPACAVPPHVCRRRGAIIGIKLIHSAIFLVVSTSILHILVAGIRGRPSRWTGAALVAALAESAVFAANRGRCPLTDMVEDLGAASGRVSDIFLPRWFADRIPQIYTPPLVIGVLTLLWHHRRRGRAPAGLVSATGDSAR